MTDNAIQKLAELFESTWPKQYLTAAHKKTVQMLRMYFGPFDNKEVLDMMQWAAQEFDSFPGIKTLTGAISKKKAKRIEVDRRKYFEDTDGCGYMWCENEQTYSCIWKPWWNDERFVKESNDMLRAQGKEPTIRLKTKMQTLKDYGLIDY